MSSMPERVQDASGFRRRPEHHPDQLLGGTRHRLSYDSHGIGSSEHESRFLPQKLRLRPPADHAVPR